MLILSWLHWSLIGWFCRFFDSLSFHDSGLHMWFVIFSFVKALCTLGFSLLGLVWLTVLSICWFWMTLQVVWFKSKFLIQYGQSFFTLWVSVHLIHSDFMFFLNFQFCLYFRFQFFQIILIWFCLLTFVNVLNIMYTRLQFLACHCDVCWCLN